jgi:hypothetical protein
MRVHELCCISIKAVCQVYNCLCRRERRSPAGRAPLGPTSERGC